MPTGVVILLWAGYTALQTLYVVGYISDGWSAILGFMPGLIGLGILLLVGHSRQELYLVARPLSRPGFLVLTVVFLVALGAVLPFSFWGGWNWKGAFIYAPASGISQELFFRSVLLPVMVMIIKGRKKIGLVLHSLLFGLWHIGPLFVGAPPWAVMAVMLVPFLCGLGWGWQVQRDGTVLWAMLQHSLIWVIGLQFILPGG
ncbi:MAG: CPBP family intramembrane metalloprotease [Anaerolineales bacterium]|nr:CPBP family intramembrane metalloprotease [Anaerolineales bacterium]